MTTTTAPRRAWSVVSLRPVLRAPRRAAGATRGKETVEEPARGVPFELRVDERALTPSFVQLYEERYAPMVRLAVALTGSEPLAEDLVQDAFVRVHARWGRIETPAAYLRAAVVNACRSAGRRVARERAAASRELATADALNADELFDALAQLPYRQRAALVLQFYEGLSQAEIAEVLGCREGTVASLVHRGLVQLRRVIEP
jgi:RNA polymerase sigma-70 factor (sigma-E family)